MATRCSPSSCSGGRPTKANGAASRCKSLGNDRWQAAIVPSRIGRHEFTVEAWWDTYATLCRDLEIKRAAGMDIALEIAEGRQLLEQAQERARG